MARGPKAAHTHVYASSMDMFFSLDYFHLAVSGTFVHYFELLIALFQNL